MHPYLIADICFLAVWIALYLLKPASRRKMVLCSVAWLPAAPVLQSYYVHDYWMPEYLVLFDLGPLTFGIEDFLFAFTIAGITTTLFDCLLRRFAPCGADCITARRYVKLQLLALSWPGVLGVSMVWFNQNSVHATVLACSLGAAVLLLYRGQDGWMRAAFCNGLLAGGAFWAFYQFFFLALFPSLFSDYWYADALSGIHLGNVPIEEVAWAAAIGIFVGTVGNHFLGPVRPGRQPVLATLLLAPGSVRQRRITPPDRLPEENNTCQLDHT